jgi:hypothetical protein
MNDFLKMDIFFVVATVAVVLLTLLGAVLAWRFLRILKNIEIISAQVVEEGAAIRSDLATLRAELRGGKGVVKSFFKLLGSRVKRTIYRK